MGDIVLGDLQWEGEEGNRIESFNESIGVIFRLMGEHASEPNLKTTFCLQFIDQWGDTTFNQLQIPQLISELRLLLSKAKSEEDQAELESIIKFIEKAKGKIHTYIKFYGD
jgi:hypothetical protein